MSVMGSRYMGHVSVILHLTVFSPVMNVIAYLGSGAGRWVRGKDGLLSKSEDPSLALQPSCTKWGRAACIAVTRMYRRPTRWSPASLRDSVSESKAVRGGAGPLAPALASACACTHSQRDIHCTHSLRTWGRGERARATSLYL